MTRWAADGDHGNDAAWQALKTFVESWSRPRLPLNGADIMAGGVAHGPLVGRVLELVEQWWIDNDFVADRAAVLGKMRDVIASKA